MRRRHTENGDGVIGRQLLVAVAELFVRKSYYDGDASILEWCGESRRCVPLVPLLTNQEEAMMIGAVENRSFGSVMEGSVMCIPWDAMPSGTCLGWPRFSSLLAPWSFDRILDLVSECSRLAEGASSECPDAYAVFTEKLEGELERSGIRCSCLGLHARCCTTFTLRCRIGRPRL